jgi:FtsH-binding integral membrane protein
LLGAFIGFIIRIVTLKASSLSSSSEDAVSFLILSHADIGLHALIWISFFALAFTRKSSQRRQILTSSVINLLIGVIVGSFLAWNFVDMTLGFPLSCFQRLVCFNLMLLQCWLVHRCHEIDFHEPSKELPAENETAPGPSILMIV